MNIGYSVSSIFKRCMSNALDFLYPPLCIVCSQRIEGNSKWFCPDCLQKLDMNAAGRNACPLCAISIAQQACFCASSGEYNFEKAFSFFDFDDMIQTIVHQFKYKAKSSLAAYIGKTYGCTIPDSFFLGMDGIISVPLHFLRKMQRGYNQAEFFAIGLQQGITPCLPYRKNILHRIKNTKTQTKLDRKERQKNLSNAFKVNPKTIHLIRNKKLILVDDVITTGATINVCTKVLLEAGVKDVRVISMARR